MRCHGLSSACAERRVGALPLTETVGAREITLPLHPLLGEREVTAVVRALEEALDIRRHSPSVRREVVGA